MAKIPSKLAVQCSMLTNGMRGQKVFARLFLALRHAAARLVA